MYRSHVLVCGGTGCTSSNSTAIIEALEKEIADIESTLSDPSIYSKDPSRAAALAERLEPARAELDEAETRWLELSGI